MGKVRAQIKTEFWHMCHCTGKDETSTTHIIARWTTAFGLLGFFLLLFGGLILRKGYEKQTDPSHMRYAGPIILIVGAACSLLCIIMSLTLIVYLFRKRKQREKNPLSKAFIDDGYPQVIELVDWGHITPTRTENSESQSLDIRLSDVESVDETQS